ncbi:hypothetical protein K501DRAFT_165820, partial [Backusella circina FSU 941]
MPDIEIMALLATGGITKSLLDFFRDFLTTSRIKEWETEALHGYKCSLAIITEYISLASEKLQIQLSKLSGYSLWKQRYGDLLESQSIDTCLENGYMFIKQINAFVEKVKYLMERFEAFVAWMNVVTNHISDPNAEESISQPNICEDPELVTEYLTTMSSCEEMLNQPSKLISQKILIQESMSFRLANV